MTQRVILGFLAGIAVYVGLALALTLVLNLFVLPLNLLSEAESGADIAARLERHIFLKNVGQIVCLALASLGGGLVAGRVAGGWEVPMALAQWLLPTLVLAGLVVPGSRNAALLAIALTLPAALLAGVLARHWRIRRAARAAAAQLAAF